MNSKQIRKQNVVNAKIFIIQEEKVTNMNLFVTRKI